MTIAMLFWILMLFWLVFGLYWNWPQGAAPAPGWYWPVGSNLLLFILLFLLGWHAFGFPIRG